MLFDSGIAVSRFRTGGRKQLAKGGWLRRGIDRRGVVWGICGIASLCLVVCIFAASGDAQTAGQAVAGVRQSAPKTARQTAGKRRKPRAGDVSVKPQAKPMLPAASPATPTPPAPPAAPNWPALSSAKPAEVHWDGKTLSVTAENSSLQQILQAVSAASGVAVEGMGSDQRVFGSYGPAPAREVLSELLEGSGYDLLMVGDRGDGKPLKVLLTARGAAAAPSRPAYSAAGAGAVGAAGNSVSAGSGEGELINPEAPHPGQWTVGKQPTPPEQAGEQPDAPQSAPNVGNLTPQQFIEQRMRQVNQQNAAQQQQQPPQ